uniref:Misato Segment II tubulin-like domain-containing protein n=1 Tax=Pyrodinium bahamense TaxID=73915 RepID=A0A7S0A9Y2_9DINO|mmetsp:Transcript_28813/g.79106  ORF Transcript_28813/g.79106 Transcript_28813/m.79106 type:complete len:560 (+) Transcript_28813:65-1744(+)
MEVLTLQFGNFANHIGAHFWNFQDEIAALEAGSAHNVHTDPTDFERLHSQAEHSDGVHWRPRLLLVDRRGALYSACPAKQHGQPEPEPESHESPSLLWDHATASHCSEPLESHSFQQDLEREDAAGVGGECGEPRASAVYDFRNSVRSWTDYLKVQLPAASVHELQGWQHGVAPFATYFDGLQVRGSRDEEPLLELARRQLELCDQLDAVHAVLDMHNGFSGVADVVLRWVQEEQPKCGKFVLAVQPDMPANEPSGSELEGLSQDTAATVAPADTEACAWVSAAFSFAGLLDTGIDIWTPAAVPLWNIARRPPALAGLNQRSAYESSALIAAALETASLPYRLCGGRRPSQFLATLAPAYRPVCGLLQALPLPCEDCSQSGGTAGRTLAELSPHFLDLASTPALPDNPYTSLVLRGETPHRLLSLCSCLPARARCNSFVHPASLPLPLPFPQLFGLQVSCRGVLPLRPPAAPARLLGEEVEACPVATQLHASAGAGRCAAMQRMRRAVWLHQRSAWAAAARQRYGIEADEFREALEAMVEHAEGSGAVASSDEAEGEEA